MERTIIAHDTVTGLARIRHEWEDGTVVEDDYNLIRIVPSTEMTFTEMGITFDEEYQTLAIEKLSLILANQHSLGILQPPPPVEQHEYVAPSAPEAE